MKRRCGWLITGAVIVTLLTGCDRTASVAGPRPAVVSPFEAFVALGHRQHFTLTALDTARSWSVLDGPRGGYVSAHGNYYAPLSSSAPSPVTIEGRSVFSSAQATVYLVGTTPRDTDCLGTGQATDVLQYDTYIYVEELPEAIVRVPPSYPDLAREAGVEGTVLTAALVCACGEIQDVHVVQSIPMLDQAAVDAVRQWLFKPALEGGEPVAVWVHIPVRFSLHSPGDDPSSATTIPVIGRERAPDHRAGATTTPVR